MAIKWISDGKGIRYYEHQTRKYGKRPDRYYTLVYRLGGKIKTESLGWESENRVPGGESLLKRAQRLLATLRENWRVGEGPQTLAEMRDCKKAEKEKKQAQEEAERNRLISLDDFYEHEFKPFAARSKKQSSCEKEFSYYQNWIKPILAKKPLVNINMHDWERILQPMDVANKSVATKRYVCGTLCRILKCASDRGFDVFIPTMKKLGISNIGDNRRTRVISEEEMKSILENLRDRDRNAYNIVLFGALTGCRFSEAAGLRWGDITDSGITFRKTKNKETRTIPMSNPLKNFLVSLEKGENTENVFLNTRGEVYKEAPQSFRKVIKQLGLNENHDRLDRISYHSLRHTVATMLSQDLDIRSLMDLLGWKQIAMPARYMHGNEEKKVVALDKVGSLVEEKKQANIIKFTGS
ncbi:MAG: site-specific integrase [Desulfovibrio piger]|nr:site-specific integrase [Desulfovibrio piger]